MTDVILSDY